MASRSGSTDEASSALVAFAASLSFFAALALGDVPFGSTPASRPFGGVVVATFLVTAWLGYRERNVVAALSVGAAPFLGVGTGAILDIRNVAAELPGIVSAAVGGSVLVGVGGYAAGVALAWLRADRDVSAHDLGRLGVLVLGAAAVAAVAGVAYWTAYPEAVPA